MGTQTIQPSQVRIQIIRNNGTFVWFTQSLKPTYIRRISSSSDITSHSGVDGRFRPVFHSKASYLANPLTNLPQYLYGETTFTSPSDEKRSYILGLAEEVHARRYDRFRAACDSVDVSLASLPWNTLGATALSTMLPTFHSQNSLVNFILELKDFKSVAKYIWTDKISKKLGILQALTGIRKSDKTLKQLSKLYLSYSFGWRPLFSDLVSFLQTVTGFVTRYKELVQRAGRPQQSYWGTWVAGSDSLESVYYTNGTGDGPTDGWIGYNRGRFRLRCIREASQGIRFHATVRYRYAIPPELLEAGGKAKAWLDVLGVSGNPAILWNAIPFSFIVDWVVNVSKYLDRLRVDNIHFKTEILDFCTSARVERRVRLDMGAVQQQPGTGLLYEEPFWTTDRCSKVVYERRLGLPNFLTAIQTSGLNVREFSLAGALVSANRK